MVVKYYCIIFYVLMVYKWFNGMFMYQMQPSFFYIREDIFTWFFMQTGLHQWLLNNNAGCILLDTLFYAAPLVYFISFRYNPKLSPGIAIAMLLINWSYIQCYTLFPTNSIEGHLAWLLFPVIFIFENEKTFQLLFEGLRYFFLFFFFSSGIWKLAQGGLFNPAQMSGVLLFQHSAMLTNSPFFWQSKMILYLIQNKGTGYFLYLSSALLQLFFITGFFTKKYERWLAIGFIFFLLMDYLIMRIPYFEVMPLLLTLLIHSKRNRVTKPVFLD